MRRIFKIAGFLYLAFLGAATISGGHIDHNGAGQHLCFESCQPVDCQESTGQTCFDESILEHIFENSNNIKTISLPDDTIVFVYRNNIILKPDFTFTYIKKTELFSSLTFQFNTPQNRAPPYFV
jgi:hypothetical protein